MPRNCDAAYERIRQPAYVCCLCHPLTVVCRSPARPLDGCGSPPERGNARGLRLTPPITPRSSHGLPGDSWRLFSCGPSAPRARLHPSPSPRPRTDEPLPHPEAGPSGRGRGAPLGSRLLRTPAATHGCYPLTALTCCSAQLRPRIEQRTPVRRRPRGHDTTAVRHHDAHVAVPGAFHASIGTLASDDIRERALPLLRGHEMPRFPFDR